MDRRPGRRSWRSSRTTCREARGRPADASLRPCDLRLTPTADRARRSAGRIRTHPRRLGGSRCGRARLAAVSRTGPGMRSFALRRTACVTCDPNSSRHGMKTRASGTAPEPYLENCAGGIDALRTRHAQLAAARFESLPVPVERRGARDRTSPTPSACIVSRNSSPGRRSTRSLISATCRSASPRAVCPHRAARHITVAPSPIPGHACSTNTRRSATTRALFRPQQ